MFKNILVTGGCGFIGSNFIRYMLSKNGLSRVVNLDKLTYAGNKNNLSDIEDDKRYRFIKGDICDKKKVNSICARESIDCIINFAAETHVDRSITGSEDFLMTNVLGVAALLQAAKKHKVELFIQISSDEVYGSCDSGSFKESSPLNPSNPYSASKAAADLLVLSFYRTYGLPVMITRSSNNFGPYQFPEKIIPLFITNLIDNKKLPLYGDGLNIRDWTYVLDNAKAIDLVMRKGSIGEVYNIGSGNLITNIELTEMILQTLKRDNSSIERVSDRPGHDRRYAVDSSKVRSLGWQEEGCFEDALKRTVNWYKENISWWRPLKDGKDSRHWLKWNAGPGAA
jgi:dTDP-glucose 4,6-dehydratase